MDVALQDAPGVTSAFNWITDIGGALDPGPSASPPLSASLSRDVLWFTLSNIYNTQSTAEQNASTAMVFNQMGILSGPSKNHDGTSNVGGVVRITLNRYQPESFFTQELIAQANVDLTNAVPGHFYWSTPLPNPISVWGRMFTPPSRYVDYVYSIDINSTVPYSTYTDRLCTLRNGVHWGVSYLPYYNAPFPTNDHLCVYGPVDLTLNNYVDLGRASLVPNVAFSGQPKREGGLQSSLSPRVQLVGQPRRIGVFDSVNVMVKPVLYATSMAGGPLWKPSKLCSG